MSTTVFAPGCALMLYKPHLAEAIAQHLGKTADVVVHDVCCQHEPGFASPTVVVNTCPGCDRRFRSLYEGVSTVSLWEVLATDEDFEFPDYGGAAMAIHDACPTRSETRVHDAVRTLLQRMNIEVLEPYSTRERAVCCGDSLYGSVDGSALKKAMTHRADAMPADDVVVYCVSCVKSIHVGGKRPRYLIDLLFGEESAPGTFEPDEWHAQLEAYIEAH